MIRLGFTRPASFIEKSLKDAESMGFDAIAAPSLEILPGTDEEFRRMEEALDSPRTTTVFTSVKAVEAVAERYGWRFASMFDDSDRISIGPSTTESLISRGMADARESPVHSSDGVADMLSSDAEGRVFIVLRSDSGSDVLSARLTGAGGTVVNIAAYRLEPARMCPELERLIDAVCNGGLDALLFTSPMSAKSFIDHLEDRCGEGGRYLLKGMVIGAIGGPTSDMLSSLGLHPDVVPGNATFVDLLEAVRGRLG